MYTVFTAENATFFYKNVVFLGIFVWGSVTKYTLNVVYFDGRRTVKCSLGIINMTGSKCSFEDHYHQRTRVAKYEDRTHVPFKSMRESSTFAIIIAPARKTNFERVP